MVKKNGLKDYFGEDETLKTKLTYEEFSHVEYGFDDSGIEEAFETCKEVLEK